MRSFALTRWGETGILPNRMLCASRVVLFEAEGVLVGTAPCPLSGFESVHSSLLGAHVHLRPHARSVLRRLSESDLRWGVWTADTESRTRAVVASLVSLLRLPSNVSPPVVLWREHTRVEAGVCSKDVSFWGEADVLLVSADGPTLSLPRNEGCVVRAPLFDPASGTADGYRDCFLSELERRWEEVAERREIAWRHCAPVAET
jgi:hypothetical protein